ncbi:TonB-dependent receptor [Sphingobium phenoxybenzoativorans]|uniref:TonB-dependent receptor n=1 Tax=Sphingobium phenoxybenzoativorans TaxID=1592790 RepID=A0A975K583_9SPHN|nr:TonB-dependent receptor [Sphingobium phenoxybenzoativorans]QUT04727.1 TonB-dependent receptor [Sphingobium phenoxybenzoativorans]
MSRTAYLLVSAAALALAAHIPASAQTASTPAPPQGADEETSGLADIVVTATRRDTNLQRTAIAVSAVDQSIIEQSNPRSLGDLAVFVPNFSAATVTNFNAASFSMRGIGQNTIIIYFEPPVAVLVDDFVMPSVQTQLLDTFDVAQVEVLRGPQGTLFGKNTTGGAVVVKTKKPELGTIGAELRGQVGDFKTRKLQGAFNVPIGDTLAFRGVIGYEYSDGYYRNGACYGLVVSFVPSKFAGRTGCGDGERLGGRDVWNARAKLLWEPSSNFNALLQYENIRDDSESIPGVNETNTGVLFDILGVGRSNPASKDPLNNAGISNRDDTLLFMQKGHRVYVDGLYLNMNLNVGFGTFTSVSGIRKQKSRLPSTYPDQAPVAADGEILSLFDASRDDDRKTWQQELRFASDLGGAFDFVAGGFYQHDEASYCVTETLGFQDLVTAPTPYGTWNQTPYILCNAQKGRSTAVFAEGTLKLAEGLTLTGGARYTWEKKRWWGRQQVFIPQLNGGNDPSIIVNEALDANVFDYPAGVIQIGAKSSDPTWRASISYQANPDLFLYGTYSRGFKGGGFNDQIGTFHPFLNADGSDNNALFAAAAAATKPETADSFEIGVKSEFLDRRVRFNVTGFHVTYSNLQKQIVVPLIVNGQPFQVTTFFNAAKAVVKGVEAELTAIPARGLTLRGVFGYQDGKYKEYVTPIPAGYNLADAPLDRAPKVTWSADATYELPISDFKLLLNGNVNYVGRNLFTQSIDSLADNTYLNARTLLNASITLAQQDDSYYVRLIGQNLADKRYKTASQVVGGLWQNSQYGPPRYFGLEVGLKFSSAAN